MLHIGTDVVRNTNVVILFQQNSVMYFKNLPEEMTRWDLFDFLTDTIDIETAIRMDIKQGRGYVVFHSEQDREAAYLRLNSKFTSVAYRKSFILN